MRRSPWAIERRKPAPNLAPCHTHSAFQCSTAVKIQPHPSSNVKTRTPSVPHITFGACVTIVPACTRAAPWRPRAACAPASPAAPASARPGSRPRSAAARGPSDGPRPGTASGRDRPESPPAASRPTPWASDPAARAPRPCALLLACLPGVERRARALPRLTHALDPVGAPRGLGERGAHRRDLRIAKGRRCSAARARSRSSSFSIDSSPMCRFAASSVSATRSPWRACKPRSRPATARSASPPAGRSTRSSRSTTSRFRPTLQRCPGARGPASPAAPSAGTPVALRAPSVPADVEPFPPPPWTLDSPLISVQENWGRFSQHRQHLLRDRGAPVVLRISKSVIDRNRHSFLVNSTAPHGPVDLAGLVLQKSGNVLHKGGMKPAAIGHGIENHEEERIFRMKKLSMA